MLRDLLIPGRPVRRVRESAPATFTRQRAMGDDEAKADGDGVRSLLVSSDKPCAFRDQDGVFHEILSHAPGACDTRSCRAVLLHHRPTNIIGAVRSLDFKDGLCSARVAITKSAMLPTGTPVDEAVENGSLRGVSTGYEYLPEDADVDEDKRTITVRNWRMHEVTLTPTPRDGDMQVMRSTSDLFTRSSSPIPLAHNRAQEPRMKISALRLLELQRANPALALDIGQRAVEEMEDAAIVSWIAAQRAAHDETQRAQAIAAERATAAIIEAIVPLAESHNLRASDYVTAARAGKFKTLAEATAKMLEDKTAASAARSAGFNIGGTETGVVVTRDAGDKLIEAASDSLLCRTNVDVRHASRDIIVPYAQSHHKDEGMRGLDFHSIVRRCARACGEIGVDSWGKRDIASWIMFRSGRMVGTAAETLKFRASANQVSALFPTLLANVMDRAMVLGFQNYASITYDKWTRERQVQDFKQFNTAGAVLGNLRKTVEDGLLGELNLKDGGYNSQLAMWGGTVSLTFEALTNDDLGEFWRMLGQVGMVAKRTIDREVYNQLMSITWATSATQGYNDTTVAPLATAGSLDTARADFAHKKGPGGENMGNTPVWLLHAFGRGQAADRATGRARAPGEQSYLAGENVRNSIQPLECVYLDDTTVNAAATPNNCFLVGDRTVDTMIVALLEGMQTPQVMEYDAGATVARKFKIFHPFVAVPATYTDDKGTTGRLLGIQRTTES